VRVYLLVLAVAAVVTYLLVPLVAQLAYRIGAVPQVRERDVHLVPVPRMGGLAMLGGLLAGMWVASHLPLINRALGDTQQTRGLLLGATVICLVGVADDVWDLDAVTKLAGQALAAGVAVTQGMQMLWLPLPDGPLVLGTGDGALVTVVLILVTVNAMNFVDGLDGLAAGIAGIAAVAFFSYSYWLFASEGLSVMVTPVLVTAVLTGMCLGFLPHNSHPARIFMGDSGSMLLGYLLAAGTITLTGQFTSGAVDSAPLPTLMPLLLPVAVLAVPFLDLVSAVVRRTRAGQAPWSPDKQHLHHRLLGIGHSHRRAVHLMYGWSAVVAFGTVLVGLRSDLTTALVVLAALVLLAVVTVRGVRRARVHSGPGPA
jgi:UDP-GlcNAc:undecaprenyl-phosphate GlcNAc-1-phosphate transferase